MHIGTLSQVKKLLAENGWEQSKFQHPHELKSFTLFVKENLWLYVYYDKLETEMSDTTVTHVNIIDDSFSCDQLDGRYLATSKEGCNTNRYSGITAEIITEIIKEEPRNVYTVLANWETETTLKELE